MAPMQTRMRFMHQTTTPLATEGHHSQCQQLLFHDVGTPEHHYRESDGLLRNPTPAGQPMLSGCSSIIYHKHHRLSYAGVALFSMQSICDCFADRTLWFASHAALMSWKIGADLATQITDVHRFNGTMYSDGRHNLESNYDILAISKQRSKKTLSGSWGPIIQFWPSQFSQGPVTTNVNGRTLMGSEDSQPEWSLPFSATPSHTMCVRMRCSDHCHFFISIQRTSVCFLAQVGAINQT
eukprot:scaffold87567_cov43-Attheya_sp.AAC.4